jgi:hypothetical protein
VFPVADHLGTQEEAMTLEDGNLTPNTARYFLQNGWQAITAKYRTDQRSRRAAPH